MQEIDIKVESFEDVRAVADLAAVEDYEILVTDGHCTVNASSLMCFFSLKIDAPLRLHLSCDREKADAFRKKAAHFLA